MKRLIAVLSGLLVLPAFAEIAPIYYDEVIEYSDMDVDDDVVDSDVADVVAMPAAARVVGPAAAANSLRSANTGRATSSRAVAASGSRTVAPSRTVTARGTTTRNATTARTAVSGAAAPATASRAAVSRGTASRATASRAATTSAGVTTRRSATTSGATNTARAGTTSAIVQTDTVNKPLYTSARVGVRGTAGIGSRTPTVRMASATAATTTETVTAATTTSDMDELAQLTDFCKAQYMQCMDNYCNVLDDNQGRCSCSANLKNYAATEAALEKANNELQEVAQKIQYLGLTADQVESLFAQTEAEAAMSGKGEDSTELSRQISQIKKLVVDVKTVSATSSAKDGFSMEGLIDIADFASGATNAMQLFSTSKTKTNSISNQRGDQLYKTAAARCKASVLNSCTAQGVDASLITNAYDLEIDKHCVQYERALTDANKEAVSMARNANSFLQRARLSVSLAKNEYETLQECVSELDKCMKDQYVCGSDYENCLDPTGKWIVNGEIVVGSTIGDSQISDSEISDMLRAKIGTIDARGRVAGMCASVMKKCQNYTMQKNGAYDENNSVVTEYIVRTSKQIKRRRQDLVSEYARECLADVLSCLNKNNSTSDDAWFSDIAINSCRGVITTCKSVTSGGADNNVKKWLQNVIGVANNNVNSDNNDDYDPIQDIPDAVPGINDYHEVTVEELELMRQEDIAACQKISGAKVSESGALCIIHGINESISRDTVLAMAKKAVAAYGGVVVFGVDNNRGYSETFAKHPYFNARMYMMRFAYYQAKTECENRGGSLNIVLGDFREGPICRDVPVVNEEECISFRSDAPAPYTYELQSFYDASTGMCRYLAHGMYFYSREIPGQCSSGATENALGDCEF